MGRYAVPLMPRGGVLQGEAVLPMPGRWRLARELRAVDGRSERFTTELVAPGAPGNQRKGRLSLRAAFMAPPTAALAVLALGDLALGAALLAWGYLHLRPAPFFAGLGVVVLGSLLLYRAAWIDA